LDSVHGANYVDGAILFPQQIGLAATFNTTHAYEAGRITAKDTRAAGIPWVFAPILDIAVHKLWPRVYESFGEG
jgi:beta-glucosidase